MEYITTQLQTASKESVLNVVEYLTNNSNLIPNCIKLGTSNENPISWRICWTFRHLADLYPSYLKKYTNQLIANLENYSSESCKASILKTIHILGFDIDKNGHLFDYSLDLLVSAKKSAVKYYAIDIAMEFIKGYPELGTELSNTLEIAIPSFSTTSLISKAKKTIKKIQTK